MQAIWTVTRRELQSFFDSLVAYILLVAFLGFTGFFTWLYGQDIFYIKQATLLPFFSWASILFVVFIPALTMRTLAEETRTGTMEVLLTRAVSDWQVVVGKYLAVVLLLAISLAFTLPYYFTVSYLGPIDHGATICGYLGLLLLGSAFTGVGIFTSSITNNQIVAFLLSLIIGLFFIIFFNLLAGASSGFLADALHFLSFDAHFESIARGVIDTRDVLYFLLVTALGLILAEYQLAQRNIVR